MPIREGAPADVDALRRIARASFDRVYAFFAVRGVRGAWPFLIADVDGVPAGFLVGRWFEGRPPIGYVYFIAVDSNFRRRGIARTLVDESMRRFAWRGATRIFAAVTEANEASSDCSAPSDSRRPPRRALWRWYGWRGLSVELRMVLAPHEALLVRFIGPSSSLPKA